MPPSSALELLRLVKQDMTAVRTAKQSSDRRRRQDFSTSPNLLDDARQAGLEEGLLIALQVITKRMQLESAIHQPGMSRSLIDARLKLQAAEVSYALTKHAALAPISSATYSTYVQACKVLEQSRAHYQRVALNESGKPAAGAAATHASADRRN